VDEDMMQLLDVSCLILITLTSGSSHRRQLREICCRVLG
jgi:hypothetical protein